MAKEATLQVRMDAELKEQVEALYKRMGTSFSEAVRIFARQSIQDKAMPFVIHIPDNKNRKIGVAKGKITIPENIDKYNDEILDLFGGSE